MEILNFVAQKGSQGHGVQFSQIYHSMKNVKIYKWNFYIFYFLKGVTCIHDFNRQTDTETVKPLSIGECYRFAYY